LQGAWTLSLKTKRLIKIKTFDVQGMTTSKTQIFISAYDATKRGESIIFVLDKQSGVYLKSLILPGAPHAGGLAYDQTAKILWVTGNHGKQAMINGIGQYQMDHVNFARSHRAVHYDLSVKLPEIPKASAITLTQQQLWVGYFNAVKAGELQAYQVTRHLADGGITIGQQLNRQREVISQPNAFINAVPKLQGVAANQKQVYMSASFGRHDSLLVRYERQSDGMDRPSYIVLPPYLEQVSFDGKRLYLVFESATPKYRARAKVIVDRLLVMSVADFERFAKPYAK
jgi:hypothetical protein